MAFVNFRVSNEGKAELNARAQSVGFSTSVYLRNLVRDHLKRDPQANHTELLRAIQALVPTLAEAFGRTQGKPEEMIERLVVALRTRYEMERNKN